jgi:hypothetical protein
MMRRGLVFVLAMMPIMTSHAARAADETEEQAREHFIAAMTLLEQGAFREALVEFETSYDLVPVPVVLFNMAICWDELEEHVEAYEHYTRYLDECLDLTDERRQEVQSRLDEIGELVGSLEILEADDGAELWIDGSPVGRIQVAIILLETGEHALVIKAPGRPDFEHAFTISAGAKTTVVVTYPEVEPSPPETVEEATGDEVDAEDGYLMAEDVAPRRKLDRTPFIVVSSISGVLLGSAIVTGALAYTKHLEFQSKCLDERSEWKPLKDASDGLAVATDVLIGVGAAAAVTAVVLAVFTYRKGDAQTQESASDAGGRLVTAPFVTPGGAGFLLRGRF